MAYAESFQAKWKAKFCYNRVTSQTSFALAKTAWFCFTFLGSEGGEAQWPPPRYASVNSIELICVFTYLLLVADIAANCALNDFGW